MPGLTSPRIMNADGKNLERNECPMVVDLALCVRNGDCFILPEELQAVLRPGTMVKTRLGELFVTGAGLRRVGDVAADIRNGVIPSIGMRDIHPVIKQAGIDFENRLKGASRPKYAEIFPTARRGSRGQ